MDQHVLAKATIVDTRGKVWRQGTDSVIIVSANVEDNSKPGREVVYVSETSDDEMINLFLTLLDKRAGVRDKNDVDAGPCDVEILLPRFDTGSKLLDDCGNKLQTLPQGERAWFDVVQEVCPRCKSNDISNAPDAGRLEVHCLSCGFCGLQWVEPAIPKPQTREDFLASLSRLVDSYEESHDQDAVVGVEIDFAPHLSCLLGPRYVWNGGCMVEVPRVDK